MRHARTGEKREIKGPRTQADAEEHRTAQRENGRLFTTTTAGGLSASASTGFSGWSMTRTSGGGRSPCPPSGGRRAAPPSPRPPEERLVRPLADAQRVHEQVVATGEGRVLAPADRRAQRVFRHAEGLDALRSFSSQVVLGFLDLVRAPTWPPAICPFCKPAVTKGCRLKSGAVIRRATSTTKHCCSNAAAPSYNLPAVGKYLAGSSCKIRLIARQRGMTAQASIGHHSK